MNLKLLSDDKLIRDTKNLTGEERRVTSLILKHLAEIERRRLFAGLGFSSLFDYCVKDLGYSGSSAYRRIEAMRLIKDVPEVAEKIESGAMSLSVASQVQKFFRQEGAQKTSQTSSHELRSGSKVPALNLSEQIRSKAVDLSHAKKIEILQKLEGKSDRRVEQELFAISSSPVRIKHYEKQRAVSAHLTELSFLADSQLLRDLEKVKGLLAHHNLKSLAEVIAKMAELSIEKLDPSLKRTRALKTAAETLASKNEKPAPMDKTSATKSISTSDAELVKSTTSRYIPAALKKQIWLRDKSQCSYIDPRTKRKCESSHRLQLDHVVPFASGGQTTEDNLRLLCFQHNQWMAQEIFGLEKMISKRIFLSHAK